MAMIIDAFVGELVKKIVSVVEDKAIRILGVKDDLQRLQRRMEIISRVLDNAEKRRVEDPVISGWVAELKAFMYDADDVIELCLIGDSKLLEGDQSASDSTSPAVCCNFSLFSRARRMPFKNAIAKRVKSLNATLDEICKDKVVSELVPSTVSNNVHSSRATCFGQRSSVPEIDIVGGDIRDATQRLVNSLVSHDEKKCLLFAIVGMGGIGKTTLAQLIYDDSKIRERFFKSSWVCVSKEYSPEALLRGILRDLGEKQEEDQTIAELTPMLKNAVSGKSFFLVLDDVWNADVWVDLLRNPVETGAAKIRILVTTRHENVAIQMGAFRTHNVNQLSVNDGWELLCKRIMVDKDTEEMLGLRDVGIQIVEKCDGLPLAIKTVAGVLQTKDKRKRDWEKVLHSSTWTRSGLPEAMQAALYLSYEDLSSEIKPCFLHCCLVPHGHILTRECLVREWIAEGFVRAHEGISLEDVAEDYYMELIRRSLLQPNTTYVDQSECTMHDLLRTLGQFLAQDESFFGDPREANNPKLRRLSISSKKEVVRLPDAKCLRSLMLLKAPPQSLETHIIGSLTSLRVLILNVAKVDNLPKNIGDLVLLRLLDLKHTQISELPDSIGSLSNLQFLDLEYCKSLCTLPKSITKLCNLRCLCINHTPLSHVPKGLGQLRHLNDLRGFITGNGGDGEGQPEGCSLEDLQPLDNLRYLVLNKLERSIRGASVLANKQHLKHLVLNCTRLDNQANSHSAQAMNRIDQVFGELSPPSCLEKLIIRDYFGSRYPNWMSSSSISSFRELTSLHLINCKSWPQLPPLGQLPQLSFLKIHAASEVLSIGPEFLGGGIKAFPNLRHLQIRFMDKWEEWSLIREDNDESNKLVMSCNFQHLNLYKCPKLNALPRGLSQVKIQNMYIGYADNLKVVEDMRFLTDELRLGHNQSLLKVSNLPALRNLTVDDCPMLNCVEMLNSLQCLCLIDKNSSRLPKWLITFLNERQRTFANHFQLHLEYKVEALKECLKGCSIWSVIQHVPQVVAYSENKSMYLLYTKEPYSYQTNLE